jgi:hypothetical protein
VQLSELLECVRFLSTTVPYAEGGWRGGDTTSSHPRHSCPFAALCPFAARQHVSFLLFPPCVTIIPLKLLQPSSTALATARSVIIGASYRRVLEACGCGHALLNATMSKGLYGSRSQVEALGIFIDSPDPVIPGAKDKSSAWAPLFAYARCLDPSIPPAFSPPFAISLDNKYAEANTALDILTGEKKGQGKNFSRGGGDATWRRATSLARSLFTKLPGALDLSLGTLSFYGEKGDEERAKGEWTSQVLIDTLLSSVVSSEIAKANETVKVVGESLALLNRCAYLRSIKNCHDSPAIPSSTSSAIVALFVLPLLVNMVLVLRPVLNDRPTDGKLKALWAWETCGLTLDLSQGT